MFITSLPQLLRLLLYTFLLGVALGALYDLLRICKVALLFSEKESGQAASSAKKSRHAGKRKEKKERRASAPDRPKEAAGEAETGKAACRREKREKGEKSLPHRRTAGSEGESARRGARALSEAPAFLLHFITDLLFFFFAALVTVIFFYAFYRGKVRLSAIFTLFAGFSLYYFTLGRLVYALAEKIVLAVRRAIRFALSHTLLPLSRILRRGMASLWTAVRRKCLQKRLLAASEREEKAFLELAGKGFGVNAPMEGSAEN